MQQDVRLNYSVDLVHVSHGCSSRGDRVRDGGSRRRVAGQGCLASDGCRKGWWRCRRLEGRCCTWDRRRRRCRRRDRRRSRGRSGHRRRRWRRCCCRRRSTQTIARGSGGVSASSRAKKLITAFSPVPRDALALLGRHHEFAREWVAHRALALDSRRFHGRANRYRGRGSERCTRSAGCSRCRPVASAF